MQIKLKDIAKIAEVSVSTVSDILNNRPAPYSEALKRHVFDVSKELGYRPNVVARGLRTRRSNLIGVVIPHGWHAFFEDIAAEIEQDAKARLCHVITVFSSSTYPEHIQDSHLDELETLRARQVDGMIIAAVGDNEYSAAAYNRLLAGHMPLVMLDQELEDLKAPFVGVDDVASAREATKYLIDKGHRRIAHLSAAHRSRTGRDRLAGYRQALEESGIEFDPNLVIGRTYMQGDYAEAVRELLALPDLPTAVFCAADIIAAELYKQCWRNGVNIPEDISVMGYGGLRLSEYLTPPLTTMVQRTDILARRAMDILFEQIENKEKRLSDVSRVRLKAELLERDSVRSI